jgi:non-canonical purine NTP pyrophosphatase (RdgB/HAM1 family)
MQFLTSNEHKVEEANAILGDVHQLDVDIDEIQSLDQEAIVRHKLDEARNHASDVFVEDTALYFDEMNGLPGPLVKWFLEAIGPEGLWQLALSQNALRARAITMIGHYDGDYHFYTGEVNGMIGEPRGDGFGWDPIFYPDGYEQSYAELGDEKHDISHRTKAFRAFADETD